MMMMRNFPRSLAHVLERAGLALIGAAAGLFVGIQTGASIPSFTNTTFLLVTSIVGATGFYLGIDIPPHRFQGIHVGLPGKRLDGSIDVSELFAAVGTLFAALATYFSVGAICLGLDTTPTSAASLLALWSVGTLFQVAAGTTARWQD